MTALTKRCVDSDGVTPIGWIFWCPCCDGAHRLDARWTFDGNVERPTFAPSLLTLYGNGPDDARCHLFVKAGSIEFCQDSTHALAGKTVPMAPLPWRDGETAPPTG